MEKSPSQSEWKQLYEEAKKIKALAPWQRLEETDIFGVQNPETGEIGFVSVMGMLGEHLSIAVYLGDEALYDFWMIHEQRVSPERILEVPQLQASFEDRAELTAEDRQIIKSLDLKFRGRQAWPMFRAYRPGHLPWYLTAAEARYLTHVLAQTRNVVQRLDETPHLLEPSDDVTYLVRVAQTGADDGIEWTDQMMQVPPPEGEEQEVALEREMVQTLARVEKSRNVLEADFFLTPMNIQEEEDERPYLGYLLLVVDQKSGMVLGFDIMTAQPSFSQMLARLPQAFLKILMQNQMRPRQVDVQTERTFNYLVPVCEQLQIKLKSVPRLRALEAAKMGLLDYLDL